ncbi:MAG: hypothetical protein Q9227_000134 [Pyrenula ochraceoflavens]
MAGRSQVKASDSISKIKASSSKSSGRLEFILLDLSDMSSIKSAAANFLAQQNRLDVLVNNAGVSPVPDIVVMLKGTNDPNHHEIHLRTNCVGPCLLYNLLLPVLTKTASSSSTASVRVLWTASVAVHVNAPKRGGMDLDDVGRPKDMDELSSYAQSKVGNVFLAQLYARATPHNNIVHAAFNPGNLSTDLQRHWHGLDIRFMQRFLFYPAINGAYTALWAALTPDLTPDQSGAYIYPWGRFGELPSGIEASLKAPTEGGTGLADEFVAWCESEIKSYH